MSNVKSVDPYKIPYIQAVDGVPKVDLPGMRQAARDLGTAAAMLRTAGYDTFTAWSRISSCYNGPGAQQLWYGLADIGKDCDGMAGESEGIQRAMNTFCDAIDPILSKLLNLKSEAETLQKDVKNFHSYTKQPKYRFETPTKIDSWEDDDGLSDRNDDLTHRINVQVAAFQTAEREFANTIDKIYNGINYLDPYAVRTNGISYGQKVEYLDAEQNPWGAKTNVQESCAYHAANSMFSYAGINMNLDGSVPLDAVSVLAATCIAATVSDAAAWLNTLDAAEAYQLWNLWTPQQRQAMSQTYPDTIGNLPGIPYKDRIATNVYALHNRIAELEAEGADGTKPRTSTVEYQALKNIQSTIDAKKDTATPVSLVGLHIRPGEQPWAITCIGDPDNAQNVTTMVQGMNSSVKDSVSDGTKAAINLYNAQFNKDPSQSYAVFSWFEYDSPAYLNESSPHAAEIGGAQLAKDLNGFDATRAVEETVPIRTSVIAHSYGTAVAAYAFADNRAHVNYLDLEASPGIPTNICTNADQLNVDEVYASTSSKDPVAPFGYGAANTIGYDRIDPTSPEFGAHVVSAEANGDLHGVTEHSATDNDDKQYGYWEPQTNSLSNNMLITTGKGDTLPYYGTPDDRHELLQQRQDEFNKTTKPGVPGKARLP